MIVEDIAHIHTGAIYIKRTFLVQPQNHRNKSLLQFTHINQQPEAFQTLKPTGTEIE
jgi:hypothetical protein